MKKHLLLIIATFFQVALLAQNVDLDRFYFNVTYRDLPRQPLDTSYHTYSVAVESGSLGILSYKEDELVQLVEMEGWRKLSGNAHIMIRASFEDVIVEKSEVQEREQILKDKKGKQIGIKKLYSMVLTYTYGARVTINDYKGTQIRDMNLSNRTIKHTYKSPEYDTKLEAQAYFMYNMMNVNKELMRNAAMGTMRSLSNDLTVNYGFPARTIGDYMWILDSRKHPEYTDHRNAWLVVKQAMFRINANDSLNDVKAMLKPAIDYFEKVKRLYPGTKKRYRKIRYASFYNLAKIYLYLDDPESAAREASGLVMNDFDARDGRSLESAANNLQWLLSANKVTSRHFPIDINTYTGPEVITAANVIKN